MTTLIAIDGDYLNRTLHNKARHLDRKGQRLPKNMGRPRLRIDFERLAILLAKPLDIDDEGLLLNYYVNDLIPAEAGRELGRVNKYWHDRGYGFIASPGGESYFFHHQDITNKGKLRDPQTKKSPSPQSQDFSSRLRGTIVSFHATENDDKQRAEDIRLEEGDAVERYYQLRKEPFLAMLDESGYDLVRCPVTPNQGQGKAKSVDCMIYYDALRELQDEEDRLVLVSDDPVFETLLTGLEEDGVVATVAAFKGDKLETLAESAADILVLDSHLDEIQLTYNAEEEAAANKAATLV